MRLCVSPQILYDNDCFGRSVKPAVPVRQSFFLQMYEMEGLKDRKIDVLIFLEGYSFMRYY